ncbi:hypothetical protein L1887_59794 [Cichorium endivia]|nr:hypothetical protein L1887_59794 [Cichorium endivia]
MDMRSAMLTTLFVGAFCSFFPAYFSLFGPKLGMRQMIQCRYSFGYFGASVICVLNAATMLGYCILNSIVGGQTLSAVSSRADGTSTLTPDVGIVVAACIALVVSFSGIRVLHMFERFFWLPTLICFMILIGEAGTGPNALHVASNEPKATAQSILGFAAIIAGFVISYSALVSDVSHYLRPDVSPHKLFWSVYCGFFLSCVPFIMIGAAFACSSYDNDEWSTALGVSSGRFFQLILAGNLGNFGRFLVVLLALSVCGQHLGNDLQHRTQLPDHAAIPRTRTAIRMAASGHGHLLAAGDRGSRQVLRNAHRLYERARILGELWNKLPPGLAALGACAISLAVVVPSIDQCLAGRSLARYSLRLSAFFNVPSSFVCSQCHRITHFCRALMRTRNRSFLTSVVTIAVLKEEAEGVAGVFGAEDVEEQAEGGEEDGAPHIDPCALPCGIPLGRHEHGERNKAECEQRIDGCHDLRLDAVLRLKAGGKVLGLASLAHGDVGCAADRVPHVTGRKEDHGAQAEQHPDGLGRLEQHRHVRRQEEDRSHQRNDACDGRRDELGVDGLLELELGVHERVDVIRHVLGRKAALVELELRKHLLRPRELDLDKDVLRLDRPVAVPLLRHLFKLGLERHAWRTLDAAVGGGEQRRHGKVARKADDRGELLVIDVDKALARRLDAIVEARLVLVGEALRQGGGKLDPGEHAQERQQPSLATLAMLGRDATLISTIPACPRDARVEDDCRVGRSCCCSPAPSTLSSCSASVRTCLACLGVFFSRG